MIMKNLEMKYFISTNQDKHKSASEMLLFGLSRQYQIFEYNRTTSSLDEWHSARPYYSNLDFSKPITQVINCFKPQAVSPYYYRDIKFNLISCPGGYADKENLVENPFMLGETVVTRELFNAVMGFDYSDYRLYESNYSEEKANSPKKPVRKISWYDCVEFCNRLSVYFGFECYYSIRNIQYCGDYVIKTNHPTPEDERKKIYAKNYPKCISNAFVSNQDSASGFRLPTEWEWQIAAKAGTKNLYSGTNRIKDLPKFANESKHPIPVAQKLPNEWGFYDMTGNIKQWCNNQVFNDYRDEYEKAVRGCASYIKNEHIELFGGKKYSKENILSLFDRENRGPYGLFDDLSFRIARTII